MSLIRVIIFIYLISYHVLISVPQQRCYNQHTDASHGVCVHAHMFQQQHPVFVGHPNHLPLRGSGGPLLTVSVRGMHITPGRKGARGQRGHWAPSNISLNSKITQGSTKHLRQPRSSLWSAAKQTHGKTLTTLCLNWPSLIISARQFIIIQARVNT